MARTSLKLPPSLEEEAEFLAHRQGVSLDQFVLWAVAEKVGELKHAMDDPEFPHVTYRRGASGRPVPILRGTGIRVQAVVIAAEHWRESPSEIAEQYGLATEQVEGALAFYEMHRDEIDGLIAEEQRLEQAHA